MTTPHDAQPVFLVNTGELDEAGRELFHVSRGASIPMADNERLYTATDYDALRSEVEMYRSANMKYAEQVAHLFGRAGAAEALIATVREHVTSAAFSSNPQTTVEHVLAAFAALNAPDPQ